MGVCREEEGCVGVCREEGCVWVSVQGGGMCVGTCGE